MFPPAQVDVSLLADSEGEVICILG
jgi:hypothetical protein